MYCIINPTVTKTVRNIITGTKEVDFDYVKSHLHGFNDDDFDLMNEFVQQSLSDPKTMKAITSTESNEEDADFDDEELVEDHTAQYVTGYYRIHDVPERIGNGSFFENIEYPERFNIPADAVVDKPISMQIAWTTDQVDTEKITHQKLVHTNGSSNTRLTHIYRGDERGLLLNALRRMKVFDNTQDDKDC